MRSYYFNEGFQGNSLIGDTVKMRGQIIADINERYSLLGLGVELGKYNNTKGQFENCIVSPEAFIRLEPYWGYFYWNLTSKINF